MNRHEILLILPGRPITKKTHNELVFNKRTGKRQVMPSKYFREYETSCLWFIRANYPGPRHLRKVIMCAKYYMPNRRSWPDLIGLIQATCDILEKAEVIVDDKEVLGFDGSCIVGVDKLNPRVEVTLTCL